MSYIVLLAAIYCQRNAIFLKNLISVSDPQLSEDLTNVAYFKRRRREGIHCSSGIVEFISYLDSTMLIKYTKAQKIPDERNGVDHAAPTLLKTI